jgi:hypothetical protein
MTDKVGVPRAEVFPSGVAWRGKVSFRNLGAQRKVQRYRWKENFV